MDVPAEPDALASLKQLLLSPEPVCDLPDVLRGTCIRRPLDAALCGHPTVKGGSAAGQEDGGPSREKA